MDPIAIDTILGGPGRFSWAEHVGQPALVRAELPCGFGLVWGCLRIEAFVHLLACAGGHKDHASVVVGARVGFSPADELFWTVEDESEIPSDHRVEVDPG